MSPSVSKLIPKSVFYRIELLDGTGPYHAPFSHSFDEEAQFNSNKHPTISQDKALSECDVNFNSGQWRFAFKDLEQLGRWVYKKKWLTEMHDLGFKVSVTEAEGIHGGAQSVFLFKGSKVIERISLLSLHDKKPPQKSGYEYPKYTRESLLCEDDLTSGLEFM